MRKSWVAHVSSSVGSAMPRGTFSNFVDNVAAADSVAQKALAGAFVWVRHFEDLNPTSEFPEISQGQA